MRQPTRPEWTTICEIFDGLVHLPPSVQEQRLAGDDLDRFVADQVRSLLRAGRTSGMLDAAADDGGRASSGYGSLAPGTIVGAFRIQGLIGRGGMGEVYLAERAEGGFQQRVALKLLRPEAAGRTALFDSERALLASLEHPGIARLIDGGFAPDGRPFMALEYVEGREIGAWCADRSASLEDRLRLFLEVCEAVSYAHARLVVHRDLKPANVLIDADGRSRLLDFGIARLVDEAATDRTMTQALLTPDYAAPEQLENGSTTVATDVYALGALLFELLTGAGPWQRDKTFSSLVRRILHEDPPVPSRFAEGSKAPAIAPQRIAGDLDAIVLKAMRRAPADRYASVAELAEDIRRHLAFEPVRARAGTAGYHFGRFVRRNRWGVAAATAVLLAMIVGAGGVAWQARQTAIERDIARAELRRAEAAFNAMTFMFRNASDSGQIGSATARDMLNASARNLIATLRPDTPDAADTVITLADLYFVSEDPAGAAAFVRQAMTARIGAGDPVATARLQQRLGQAMAAMGEVAEAERLLDAAEQVWLTDSERFRTERHDLIGSRAYMLRMAGNREGGIRLLAESLPDAEIAYAHNPRELLTRYANLTVHYNESNRLDEADAVLRRAEAVVERTDSGATAPGLAIMVHRGAWLLRRGEAAAALDNYRRAIAIRRELYGPSAGLGVDLANQARVLLALDRPAEALRALDEAIPVVTTYLGAETVPARMARLSRAEALADLGRVGDASAELTRVAPALADGGPRSLSYGQYLRGRARLHIARRDFAAARSDLAAAEAIFAAQGVAGDFHRTALRQLRARLPA